MSFSWANFIILLLAIGGLFYLIIVHGKLRQAKKALADARKESLNLFEQTRDMCHDTLTTAQSFAVELYSQREEDVKTYAKALAATVQLLNEIDSARSMVAKELDTAEGEHKALLLNRLRLIETHCQEARLILGNASFADLQSTMERLRLTHEREAQLFNRLIDKMAKT